VSGLTGDRYRYTGHLRDQETGNDYAGARYYTNARGRWLSVDPLRGNVANPQRLNRYSYVLNDPVNYVDVGGGTECPHLVCVGVVAFRFPEPEWTWFEEAFTRAGPGGAGGSSGQGGVGGGRGGSGGLPLLPHLPLAPIPAYDMTLSFGVRVARARVTQALSPGKIREPCAELFKLLGISPSDVVAKMRGAAYHNASLIDTPFRGHIDDPAYNTFASSWLRVKQLGDNMDISVQGVFEALPGLNALALPWWNTVLFRSSQVVSPALLAHEILHFVDPDKFQDTYIQERWGLEVDANNTGNITEKFRRECL
jgi:RHS repeat-associated protein